LLFCLFHFLNVSQTMAQSQITVGTGANIPNIGSAISAGLLSTNPQNIIVVGTFTIAPTGSQRSFSMSNATFRMQPGSKILVTGGCTFATAACTFLSANSTTMWAGIEVGANTAFSSKNSFFKNAYKALDMKGNASLDLRNCEFINNFIGLSHTNTVATVFNVKRLENNKFYGAGTMLQPYTGQPAWNSWARVGMELRNSVFSFAQSSNPLFNEMHHVEYGMHITQNSTVRWTGGFYFRDIKDYSSPNSSAWFQNGTAVYAEQSKLSIIPAMQEFILFGKNGVVGVQSDISIIGSTFVNRPMLAGLDNAIVIRNATNRTVTLDNLILGFNGSLGLYSSKQYAIAIMDSPDMSRLNVTDVNCFTDNLLVTNPNDAQNSTGILISNSSQRPDNANFIRCRSEIRNAAYGLAIRSSKNINFGENGFIGLANPLVNIAGVLLENATNARIQNSIIAGSTASNSATQDSNDAITVGLTGTVEGVSPCGIVVNATDNATICGNIIGNHYTNILAQDGCGTTSIRNNGLGDSFYGLLFTESLVLQTQAHTNNTWTGTFTGSGGKHRGNVSGLNNRLQGFFIADFSGWNTTPPLDPNTNLPDVIVNTGLTVENWFGDVVATAFIDCAPLSAMPAPTNTATNLFNEGVAEGQFDLMTYNDELKYWSQQQLYERIRKEPQIIYNNTILQNFKDSIGLTIEKDLYDIKEAKSQYLAFTPIEKQNTILAAEGLNTAMSNYQILYEAALGRDSLINSADSIALSLQQNLVQSYATTYHNLQIQGLATQQNAALLIFNDNQSLVTTPIQAQNEKIVNMIELGNIQSSTIINNTADIAYLQSVANQCPITGGRAVYQARALLAAQGNTTFYNNNTLCAAQNIAYKTQPTKTKVSHKIGIYPNPANDYFTVPNSNTPTTITVFDSMGRTIMQTAPQTTAQKIDTAAWVNGLYFVQIQNNTEAQTQTLSIAH
jgi:hypothetical protein